MQDIYKNFHVEEIEGFTVKLEFEDEHESPEDTFESELSDIIQGIYSGELCWLVAHVTVSKCGVELGHSALGGICYEWHKLGEFVADEFLTLADEAISEANAKLQELRAA